MVKTLKLKGEELKLKLKEYSDQIKIAFTLYDEGEVDKEAILKDLKSIYSKIIEIHSPYVKFDKILEEFESQGITPTEKYVSRNGLKERGWGSTAIKNLLPPPLRKKLDKPFHGYNFYDVWKEKDVIARESTPEFLKYKERHTKQSDAAQKAVQTKISKLKLEINDKISKIKVHKKCPREVLLRKTLESKENWYGYTGQYYEDLESAPPETLKRWMLNYVRHELTNYDNDLWEMAGKVGVSQLYIKYKDAVMEKIFEAYPYLK